MDKPTSLPPDTWVPCRIRGLRRSAYWLVVAAATVLFTLEPSFSLVLAALGLSALALTWIVMLVALLIQDALRRIKQP